MHEHVSRRNQAISMRLLTDEKKVNFLLFREQTINIPNTNNLLNNMSVRFDLFRKINLIFFSDKKKMMPRTRIRRNLCSITAIMQDIIGIRN